MGRVASSAKITREIPGVGAFDRTCGLEGKGVGKHSPENRAAWRSYKAQGVPKTAKTPAFDAAADQRVESRRKPTTVATKLIYDVFARIIEHFATYQWVQQRFFTLSKFGAGRFVDASPGFLRNYWMKNIGYTLS